MIFALLVTVTIYWPGLHGSFFFDDNPNILQNKTLQLQDISAASLLSAALSGLSGGIGRPISQLSFALNHYFSEFDPFAFKLTNLLIHCLNGVLIYFLALQLFQNFANGARVRLFAAGVALAWMVHPIQLSSVLYVVQRMTSLSAFFLLLALLLHVKVRQNDLSLARTTGLLSLAWLVFWPLSIMSKETGILLPGLVAAYELIIRRNAAGGLDRTGRLTLYLSATIMVAVPVYLLTPFGAWLLSGYSIREFSLSERLMTEGRVLWKYMWWILFPGMETLGLHHDDIQLSTNWLSPWTTLPAIAGLILVALTGFLTRKRSPLIAFGIAWFLIGHSLESTFIPLELAHEHRNYLPIFGVFVALVGVVECLPAKLNSLKKTLLLPMAVGLVAYFAFVTALRSEMFRNEPIRTQIEAQHHPESARANYEAGRTLAGAFDLDRSNLMALVLARKHFELANTLTRKFKRGFLGLLTLDCGTSGAVSHEVIEAFELRLHETPFAPDDQNVMGAISDMSAAGTLCLSRGDIERLFSAAVLNPKISTEAKVRLLVWLADYLWLQKKDLAAAKSALHYALELRPGDASNRFKWAQLIYLSGDNAEARRLLLELKGKPFSPEEKKTFDELLASLSSPEH
jgi:hypothetical protein